MSERNIVKCVGLVCLAAVAIAMMVFHLPLVALGGLAGVAYFLLLFT